MALFLKKTIAVGIAVLGFAIQFRASEASAQNTVPKPIQIAREKAASHLKSDLSPYPVPVGIQVTGGSVQLQIKIDTDGYVSAARIISGHRWLAAEATRIAKRLAFEPFYENDKPVEVETTVTLTFDRGVQSDYRRWLSLDAAARQAQKQRNVELAVNDFRQAILIAERVGDTELADTLNAYSSMLSVEGENAEAIRAARRRVIVLERSTVENLPDLADARNSLAFLYIRNTEFEKAEPLARNTIPVLEKQIEASTLDDTKNDYRRRLSTALFVLAVVYDKQGRIEDADTFYKRSITLGKRVLKPDDAAGILRTYAVMLEKAGRHQEATSLLEEATALQLGIQPATK